jgi:hypothetical protein
MGFTQKRCAECQRVMLPAARACPCGSREVRRRARYRTPAGEERSRTFRKKSDADDYLAGQTTDKRRGAWVDPALGQIPFQDWAQRWLELQVADAPKTIAGKEGIVRNHLLPVFGPWPLVEILPEDVKQFKAEPGGIEDEAGHRAETSIGRSRGSCARPWRTGGSHRAPVSTPPFLGLAGGRCIR